MMMSGGFHPAHGLLFNAMNAPDLPGQELLRAHQKRREEQGLQAGDTVVTSP